MEISITLDPSKLGNPDVDLRYSIPEIIEKISHTELECNGCDYDEKDNMIIFFTSETLSKNSANEIIRKACGELKLEDQAIRVN